MQAATGSVATAPTSPVPARAPRPRMMRQYDLVERVRAGFNGRRFAVADEAFELAGAGRERGGEFLQFELSHDGFLSRLARDQLAQHNKMADGISQGGAQENIGWKMSLHVQARQGYHTREFVKGVREHDIVPHCARKDGQKTLHVLLTLAHAISQKLRKRIEEIFGWAKTTGCFRKSRYRGVDRTHAQGQYVVAAANLVRMAKLMITAPPKPARA